MAIAIEARDIQGWVSHWLGTPENGYYGSSYGRNIEATQLQPFSAGGGDAVVSKLKADVPVLTLLPKSSVNIFALNDRAIPDRQRIVISIGGALVAVDPQGIVHAQ